MLALLAALSLAAPPPAPAADASLARLTAGEPSASQVQAAAALEAERELPDPSALAERRRLAALLPRLSAELQLDQRSYRVVGLQGTSEVDYARSSPGSTVMVRATWELSDLLAGRGEPAAAGTSLARARRRDEAVRKATALYFERRRLLVGLAHEPPTSPLGLAELELELARITAELDAITGGLYAGRSP